jgi:hypothetical protein
MRETEALKAKRRERPATTRRLGWSVLVVWECDVGQATRHASGSSSRVPAPTHMRIARPVPARSSQPIKHVPGSVGKHVADHSDEMALARIKPEREALKQDQIVQPLLPCADENLRSDIE